MALSDGLTKAQRLVELQHLFWRNPQRVLTSSELARRLGVHPRTVRKYLNQLSAAGHLPVTRAQRAWRLADGARLATLPVRFLLEEATAVYLAARLLTRTADEPNPAVAAAVAKLAHVVPGELRPFLDQLASRAQTLDSGRFAHIFRAFAYGWALRRVVELDYEARSRRGNLLSCRFETYLLEPAAVGSALYAVGRADPPGDWRTFKLERVRAARLTDTSFTPPPPEQLLARLDPAWGVWLGRGEAVTVRLRFDSQVAARVGETRWHPSQRLLPGEDGTLEMEMVLTSTVELLPWILGWGSHCQVLAPEQLRQEVAGELRRAAHQYGPPHGRR